mmetsp:Transcript_10929/g.15042  ORF Transcript_10929/g.15042 Transcript_10929/m.15042 type:complete len:178 (+) Transcript_10929:73-606(+)
MFSKIAYICILVAVTAAKGKWLPEIISPKKSENEAALMNPPLSIETFLNDVPRVWDALDRALYRQLMSPVMSIDTKETKKDYQLAVDLPGVQKENITILLKGNELTITAHKKGMLEEEGANFRRIERFSGNITRVITLPENVNTSLIEAHGEHGVLHITIPKAQHDVDQCATKIEIK